MYRKITILSLLALFMLGSGFGCQLKNKKVQQATKPVTLVFWSVYDDADAYQDIINQYEAIHPNIKIEYHKYRYSEYENQLLNAFAEDRGPDIFSIQNTWVKKYKDKLAPLPPEITMAYPVVSNGLQKKVSYQLQTKKSLSIQDLKNQFVDVVGHDVVLDGKIYALPMSIDTLAMYYNKDLFNNAGVSEPPRYWNNEFLQDVKKMTVQDPKQGIIQSGAALGGSDNINRFSDILSVLMMQNGATMMDGNDQVRFNQNVTDANGNQYNPGLEALKFYTDFANPSKDSYSWNNTLPNSLNMFVNGQLAIMFDYSYDLPTIKARAPKLNFSVAPLPQIEGNPPTNVNFANYWVQAVSKKSAHVDEAWNFIQFMTSSQQAKSYLQKTGHPTALRSLIKWQESQNNEISVFASEALTAKSWYIGDNEKAAEDAISNMIKEVEKNPGTNLLPIISTAAAQVQQTLNSGY